MSAAEWIAKRRELIESATEGPWIAEYSSPHHNCVVPHDARSTREAVAQTRLLRAAGDAALIADVRTSLPRALDALDAVLEEVDAMEQIASDYLIMDPTARSALLLAVRGIRSKIEAALGGDS